MELSRAEWEAKVLSMRSRVEAALSGLTGGKLDYKVANGVFNGLKTEVVLETFIASKQTMVDVTPSPKNLLAKKS